MVVGISRKDPSSSDGINSLPMPGRFVSIFWNAEVFFTNPGMKPNTVPKPCQAVMPKRTIRMGMAMNFHLFLKAQPRIFG